MRNGPVDFRASGNLSGRMCSHTKSPGSNSTSFLFWSYLALTLAVLASILSLTFKCMFLTNSALLAPSRLRYIELGSSVKSKGVSG
ncbi:unnamed protein product [Brassica oleracea]